MECYSGLIDLTLIKENTDSKNHNGNIGSEVLKKQSIINKCFKRIIVCAVCKDIRDHTFMISNMEGG